MAIRFECSCGKRLSAPEERAGKTVRCPGCGKPVEVPGAARECGTKKPPDTSPQPLSSALQELLKESVGDLPTVALKRPDDDLAGIRELVARASGAKGPGDDQLGRYPVRGTVGRGGMGEVLLVRDPEIGRDLAAKVILGGTGSAGTLADRKALEKFLVEAQVTGQLEHPNIVPVHELDVAPDGRVYFTMKRVRGKDLEKVLSETRNSELGTRNEKPSGRRRKASRASAVRKAEAAGEQEHSLVKLLDVFLRVCDAVAFAHARGVIHRDLKPANVMVGEFGEVLVMDWGLAKVRGHADRAAAQV
ncbi:MAG: serine/threonine protein kinase, partial [Planctomycetes bacterium]|nr:serine/threonine protein kinase [Planctomycetota bacterium]